MRIEPFSTGLWKQESKQARKKEENLWFDYNFNNVIVVAFSNLNDFSSYDIHSLVEMNAYEKHGAPERDREIEKGKCDKEG